MTFPDEVYPCHSVSAGAASPLVPHIQMGSEGSNSLPFASPGAQAAEEVAAYLAALSLSGCVLGLLFRVGAAPARP